MHKLYTTTIILFLISTLFCKAGTTNSSTIKLVNIVKQQQTLAKKVSKYYIDFQADQKNSKKKEKMKNSIRNFNKNHHILTRHKHNTKLINQKLTKVSEIWKIAYKLSENKKHSKMIRTSMNDISQKMKELRKLYQKQKRLK